MNLIISVFGWHFHRVTRLQSLGTPDATTEKTPKKQKPLCKHDIKRIAPFVHLRARTPLNCSTNPTNDTPTSYRLGPQLYHNRQFGPCPRSPHSPNSARKSTRHTRATNYGQTTIEELNIQPRAQVHVALLRECFNKNQQQRKPSQH